MDKKTMSTLACWLLLIGALNWGLIGLGDFSGADWNVVNMVLGAWPKLESLVYVLVGLSALYKWNCLAKCKK